MTLNSMWGKEKSIKKIVKCADLEISIISKSVIDFKQHPREADVCAATPIKVQFRITVFDA